MKRFICGLTLLAAGIFASLAQAACPSHMTARQTNYIATLNAIIDCVTATGVSPLTTKGDLWGYSSSDARFPIGTNGQVLTVDSTQTFGYKWAAPTGGAALTNTYIGYGASSVLAGTSDFTYTTSTGIQRITKAGATLVGIISQNTSGGTSATAGYSAVIDSGESAFFGKYNTTNTTGGLYTPGAMVVANNDAGNNTAMVLANASAGNTVFAQGGIVAGNAWMYVLGADGSGSKAGNVGLGYGGVTNPTARLHIKAGTATAGTAPLKLTPGTVLTAPESGAIEYDGTNLYYTDSGLTRRSLAYGAGGGGSAAGSNTQVQYNSAGSFGASSALTWSGTALAVSGSGTPNAITVETNQATGYAQVSAAAPTSVGYLSLYKFGSSYSGTGLMASSRGMLHNSTGDMVIAQAANAPMIFTVAGVATTSEVYRLPSGGGATWKIGATTLATLSSGGALDTLSTITGTTVSDAKGDVRNIIQNPQSGSYTLLLSDAGKHIFHASGDGAGDTYTIPANSSVAYIIGTAVTFVNMDSNAVSIAITTDTMYLQGAGTTGTRTLAQYCTATALKITSTSWIITGGSCLTFNDAANDQQYRNVA